MTDTPKNNMPPAVADLVARIAATPIWQDTYPDGPDHMGGDYRITPADVRVCRGALATKMEGVDIPRLPVGTAVVKVLGYPFPGTVVAAFHTLAGQERFVIEATGAEYAGMLHIFNGDQLRATTEISDRD